jgi:SAM-dependent methyltransferase
MGVVQKIRDISRPARRLVRVARQKIFGTDAPSVLGSYASDDYDWRSYRTHYERDLADVARLHTLKLAAGDFSLCHDGTIQLRSELKPLHPNHSCLYETIGLLTPASIIEIGCGGGDHLHNLGVLYPSVQRLGFDRSRGQLALLRERSPRLEPIIARLDITRPLRRGHPTAEVVYTQAVVMHIHASDRHLIALQNIFRMARKQVVLMENWWRHWFMDDIAKLHKARLIDWPDLRFYFRRAEGRPKIMIVSSNPLPFESLVDYRQLLDAMEWSPPPGAYPADGRYRPSF